MAAVFDELVVAVGIAAEGTLPVFEVDVELEIDAVVVFDDDALLEAGVGFVVVFDELVVAGVPVVGALSVFEFDVEPEIDATVVVGALVAVVVLDDDVLLEPVVDGVDLEGVGPASSGSAMFSTILIFEFELDGVLATLVGGSVVVVTVVAVVLDGVVVVAVVEGVGVGIMGAAALAVVVTAGAGARLGVFAAAAAAVFSSCSFVVVLATFDNKLAAAAEAADVVALIVDADDGDGFVLVDVAAGTADAVTVVGADLAVGNAITGTGGVDDETATVVRLDALATAGAASV